MSCENSKGWGSTVHNQCLERKPPGAEIGSWNKDCCTSNPCTSSLVECSPTYQGPMSLADMYADVGKKVNPKFSHKGVGVL